MRYFSKHRQNSPIRGISTNPTAYLIDFKARWICFLRELDWTRSYDLQLRLRLLCVMYPWVRLAPNISAKKRRYWTLHLTPQAFFFSFCPDNDRKLIFEPRFYRACPNWYGHTALFVISNPFFFFFFLFWGICNCQVEPTREEKNSWYKDNHVRELSRKVCLVTRRQSDSIAFQSKKRKHPKMPLKVVVVGAGIGALSAAVALREAGHSVHVSDLFGLAPLMKICWRILGSLFLSGPWKISLPRRSWRGPLGGP